MTVLNVQNIGKSYGTNVILSDVSFKVEHTDRVGVVGVNGTGKTTLLRLVTGEEETDSGVIAFDKNTLFAYMHQSVDYTSSRTAVDEVEDVFAEVKHIGAALDEVNRDLETRTTDALIARQCALRERFEALGGLTYHNRVISTLVGLGLTKDEIALPVSALSGGQRTCVLLARMLLSGAGLLLLDEPTNHLDIRATEWLEDFLIGYRGAVIVVSHDRFFLDRVCTRIFETENKKLTVYNGNYSYYKEKKEFDRLTLQRDYDKKCEEIARIEAIIEQQKRFNQERNYITIKSKQHQIDRIRETLVKPDVPPRELRFRFTASGNPGHDILITEPLTMAYGDNVLVRDAVVEVFKGEKVFIAGSNGCGKTTLLRHLVAGGRGVLWGAGVKVGYYEQTGASLDPDKTVFETLSDAYPRMNNTAIRSALGTFLFRGDDVFKRVGDLSGGEKARVTLSILMLSETNVLILDEPTNHLDLASKEMLEEALRTYDGTLIVVSHDRFFVNALADKIYYFDGTSLVCHRGNYASLLDAMRAEPEREVTKNEAGADAFRRKKQDEADARRRKKRFAWLEENIPLTEAKIAAVEASMCEPDVASDYEKLNALSAEADELRRTLDGYYEEWAELAETET